MKKTLSEWLIARGMSQKEFGDRIGMRQASVARIAAGLQFPRRNKRQRILEETDGEVDVYDETAGKISASMGAPAGSASDRRDVASPRRTRRQADAGGL